MSTASNKLFMGSKELKSAELWEQRMSFESLITAVATQLINLAPSEIDDGINHTLELIGEYVQADRSFVVLHQDQSLSNTHEWLKEDNPSQIEFFQNLPITKFPWLLNKLEQLTYAAVPDVAELPPEAYQEREFFQKRGIVSLVIVPMTYQGKFVGILGFDMFHQTRMWDEEISLLRIVGEMITNALKRKEIEQQEKLAYELGGQLATILDSEELLHLTINQLRDTFGYYHAQVYLLEKSSNTEQNVSEPKRLILRAATGDVGVRLKKRGHTIPLDATRSIVARAVRTQETVVVDDVQQIDYHLPNPALPYTRSEIAIPLISEQEMMGCLDVQHTSQSHFNENVIRTLQIITHQLSSALAKADLFAHNQKLVDELSLLQAISGVAAEAQNENELLSRITDILYEAFGVESIGFRLFDSDFGLIQDHPSYKYHKKRTGLLRSNLGEGITGYVLNTGKAKNIPDVSQEPGFLGSPDIRSELCVPIKIQKRVVGVLNADSIKFAAFSEHDERLFTTIADYVATALEKIRLFANAYEKAAETEALLATSKAISSLELEHVLNTIGQEAKKLFAADSCRIHLIEPDGKTMRCVIALSDRSENAVFNFALPVGQGIIGSVAMSGIPEIINNSLSDRRSIHIPGTSDKPETAALAPLAIRQQVIGVMTMTRQGTERPFLNSDLNLLTAFADQATVAIDNAHLFAAERRQLEELTILNEMTTAAAKIVREEELIETAINLTQKSIKAINFGILIADHARGVMRVRSTYHGVPTEMPMHQGVIGLVMANNQARNIPDVSQEPAFIEIHPDVRSELCVPINIKGKAIGAINAESDQLHAFSQHDERFLKTLARQLAIGLEKIQLLEAEQNRATKQQQLVELGFSLLEAQNLNELWSAMSEVAQKVLRADKTAVYKYDETTDSLSCPYAYNLSNTYVEALNERFMQVPGISLLKDPKPVIVDDAQTSPAMAMMREHTIAEGFHSYAVFQLPTSNVPLGALAIYRNKIEPFDAVDQAVGQTLAYITSVAYQNIQLLTESRHALIREQQLNDITRWLSTAPNLPAILASTIRNATELIGADAGLIGLVIDGQIMTYYPYNIPMSVNLRPAPKGSGIAWQVVEMQEAIIGDHYPAHPNAQHKFTKVGIRAFIAVPIMAGEECLGALKLFSLTPGKTFSRRDLALAESIGRQAGIVLQNRRLYTNLTERAQALSISLKKQEEADDAKNTFIHHVSHELRTPIGLIYGYAELLHSGGLGELTPEQNNSIEIIVKRVKMLINLLDDMSVLLAAETQEFRREEIQTNELLQSVIDDFQLEAEKAEIHLKSDVAPDLPMIIGDPFHLRRVFDNLLTNAFKFTPPDGNILIRGWREKDELLIEVADTGAGISPEEMQRIFERFYQANAKSAKHHKGKGTGLGLALVKEIIEAHRGKVTVRSSLGKGTAFKIRLPGIDL
jgi:GAF domain-containing protein